MSLFPLLTGCLSGLLYPAPDYPVPEQPPAPLRAVPLRLPSGEGLSAWAWIVDEPAHPGRPIVLCFHGNGENLGTLLASGQLDSFMARKIEFLAVDYPGYGRSEGRASETSVRAAGKVALAFLRETYPERPVIIAGWSLGAAAAMQTVATGPGGFAGIVLLSPWATLTEVGRLHAPAFLQFFVSDRYDSRAVARGVREPVLIMHGQADTLIPVSQGFELSREFPDRGRVKFIPLPAVGHNDLSGDPRVLRELKEFTGQFSD